MVGLRLASDDVPSRVSRDRAEYTDMTWLGSAVECRGGQVDVDEAFATAGGQLAQEQISGDVSPKLIMSPTRPIFFLQRDHVTVDPTTDRPGIAHEKPE
jgi:hypothetical protein